MTFDELSQLLSTANVGPKDGSCYTPATFTGYARNKDHAARIDIAVLDADCGHTLDEITNAIKRVGSAGWRAIVHSTHSHLSDQTIIAAEACDKWMRETGSDDVGAYLLAKKGYLPAVLTGARIEDEVHDGSVRSYLVRHAPCPKFRIVLPLQDPWIAADFDSQAIANATWRERIGALAHALGLHHDQSCVDTSRLFYLPRLRPGAEHVHLDIAGHDCPLWTLPDAPRDTPRDASASASLFDAPARGHIQPAGGHLTWQASDGQTIDLTTWAARYAGRFEVVKALRARAPGVIATRRNGVKQHIVCPCADDHITGGADQTGTYAVDASLLPHAGLASITSGFFIGCMHNGCAGRDRLGFLRALLNAGRLSIADLTDPAFLMPEKAIPMMDASTIIRQPSKAAKSAKPAASSEKPSNIHEHLYNNLPSVMAEINRFLCATSTKPQPALYFGATLAFMGAALGRKVALQYWNVRSNVYILGIGYSGSGKERVLSGLKEIALAAGLREKLIGVEDVASDAGIVASVIRQPSQLVLIDEISFLFSAINSRNAGSHIVNVISTLLKLYSSSHTYYKSKSYADITKVQTIDQPCVSFYGCSTEKALTKALTTTDITSGLLSRMVLFDVGDRDPIGDIPEQMEVPASVVDWLIAWDKVMMEPQPGANLVIKPLTVMMTDDALAIAREFEIEMHAKKLKARERGMDPLYVRARENALKFALIRGCCIPAIKTESGPVIDRENLRVDADIMRWACELSKCTIEGMDAMARDKIADTAFEAKSNALREIIRKSGSRGMTIRDMGKLSAGKLPEKERSDVLRMLCETGDIAYVRMPSKTRPREAYLHKDFMNQEQENENATE